MSMGMRTSIVALLLLTLALPALAQSPITPRDLAEFEERVEQLSSQGEPVREVQLVYSVTPWTGSTIGDGTFTPRTEDTIYVIADANSLLNARRTEVYYWPITREYMANWFEMNESIEGQLRIRQGNQVVATLDLQTYVDYYPLGSSGPRELVFGDEAVALYEEYDRALNEHFARQSAHFEAQMEQQRQIEAILRRVQETGEYVAEDEVPKSPRTPEPPTMFVYQPRTAYVVNLPAGNYQIEMVDASGNVVPDSRKKLVSFEPRRTAVGYGVVPEHMWTKDFTTFDTSEVLYLEGRRIFFMQPIEAQEYNIFQYYKSQILHQPLYGAGMKSSWAWVPTNEADPDLKVQILRDGQIVQEITRKPYYVRQTSGYALGYNIIEFNPDDPLMFGRAPSFYAYRIELEATRGSYTLQLVDADGNVIPSSVREIRSIRQDADWAMYGIPFLPLLLGLVIYIRRRRLRPRSGKQSASA